MATRRPRPGNTPLPRISKVRARKNFTPEVREKLSELAKQRFEEGKFPIQKAHTPEARAKAAETRRRNRKKTASEWVAEAAALNAAEIVAVFKNGIDASQPMGIRLKAAQAWLEVETDTRKLEIQQEAEDAKQHSRDELIAILADKLTAGPASELLRQQLESETGIVEADVVVEDVVASEISP